MVFQVTYGLLVGVKFYPEKQHELVKEIVDTMLIFLSNVIKGFGFRLLLISFNQKASLCCIINDNDDDFQEVSYLAIRYQCLCNFDYRRKVVFHKNFSSKEIVIIVGGNLKSNILYASWEFWEMPLLHLDYCGNTSK